ncbi:hypothetical protein H5T51_05870 [Candidatus Bathyarchaeota archaeon]|nr:hypothetical protein [Candidatus Bathyarchaeota archaeon]
MMDDYRRGWALRYLREAKAELEAAKKIPYMASSLVLEAVRKARNAIYYSLGEPAFIEMMLKEAIVDQRFENDPILKYLVEIESIFNHLVQLGDVDEEKAIKEADNIIKLASEIVEIMLGEKIED